MFGVELEAEYIHPHLSGTPSKGGQKYKLQKTSTLSSEAVHPLPN